MIDVEVSRTATGARRFPVAFRVEFVRLWREAVERGAKARLLREYNLTGPTVSRWLAAHERGEYVESMVAASERSGRAVDSRDRAELARLRADNERLRARVAKSEAAQAILGKAFELLSAIDESSDLQGESIPTALTNAQQYAAWLERNRLS
jgi:uncharacterized protein involved in type VI secretion and phage assembly